MEILPHETNRLRILVEKSKTGNHSAFKILYHLLSGKMYSLCLRYISDEEEAADVFRDSFAKFFIYLHTFQFEGSLEGWARRIFVADCLDFIKKKKPLFTELNENFLSGEHPLITPGKLDLEDMVKMIQKLPPEQRIVFNLYEIDGYSHKEIAGMLQITVSGSKAQLYRARILLKDLVAHIAGRGF